MDFFNSEPMKYWAPSSSMNKEDFKNRLSIIAESGKYIGAEKIDGTWSRIIISDEHKVLQGRGISKKTGNYTEFQDRVFFWDDVCKAFDGLGETVFIGETCIEGGIDRNVGSILRSNPERAKSIQDEDYYDEIKKTVKFTAKDRREIEGHEFRNKKLKLYIFDVLSYKGESLMNLPFIERIKYIPFVVAAINSPLVVGAAYREIDSNFFDWINEIFKNGGEGAVLTKKDMYYQPGKRGPSAWDTIKVKQEIAGDVDVFITRTEPALKDYTGKDITTWQYWMNSRTGEKMFGDYYNSYALGNTIIPITRGYYNDWPGSVYCGVYREDGTILEICKVSGLTDAMKNELRDNFSDMWKNRCLTLGGMLVSTAGAEPSIRHPYIRSVRDDLIPEKDCLLSKIIEA